MKQRAPELLKPTLMAGVAFGILAALPFFNLLNCACCALIVACGVLASYLYAGECRREGAEFRPGQGALVGLVAGVFYTMAHTLVTAVVRLLIGDRIARMALDWLARMPDVPEKNRELIERILERSGSFTALALVGSFFLTLFMASIFSTVGGLLGGTLFKVSAPALPAPPAPPSDLAPPPF